MKTKYILTPLIVVVLSFHLCAQTEEHYSLKLAKAITDRVIRETVFEMTEVDQKASLDIQVIDFTKVMIKGKGKNLIAESILEASKDSKISFGISNDHPIQIFIDNNLVFETKRSRNFKFSEVAYEIFEFSNLIDLKIQQGKHSIIICSETNSPAKVYLREITEPGVKTVSRFIPLHSEAKSPWSWCYRTDSTETEHKNCVVLPIQKIKQLIIPAGNIYKRESFCEWQYPNGSMLMSILDLSYTAKNEAYKKFVKNCSDFTIDNYHLFKKQYFELSDFRGTNHKMFRKCMLDDTGSPSLHILQLALVDKTKKYDWLIKDMSEYITKKQIRLSDGTFCRLEPVKYTVWADDLFMSVPFLLRMGEITKTKSYFDDAANQIINMNKYLLDAQNGVYHHAWYDYKKEQSPVLWGRANGWIIWAEAEAIKYLPKSHKSYSQIKKIFKDHLVALIKLQGENGLWHQVLDDKTSYEETSCTAMFIIGLIRAIDSGILEPGNRIYVEKAWSGLKSNISEDGIVRDISRGTGISDDINFYKARERFPNDPRGLGAVLTALNEIAIYNSK